MKFERLLAKSQHYDEPWIDSMLLPVHLADVYRAAMQVLDATGDDQLAALGLEAASYCDRFRRIVLLAAACHDLGKANTHFQGMIHESPERLGKPQGLRHEWVSVLMLEQQDLRNWCIPALGNDEIDWQIMLWAVAGHHLPHRNSTALDMKLSSSSTTRISPEVSSGWVQPSNLRCLHPYCHG